MRATPAPHPQASLVHTRPAGPSLASLLALVWTLMRQVMKAMRDPDRDENLLDCLLTEAEVMMRRAFWEHACKAANREDLLDASDERVAIFWYRVFGGPCPKGYAHAAQAATEPAEPTIILIAGFFLRISHQYALGLFERRRRARARIRASLTAVTTHAAAIRAPPLVAS